MRSVSVASSCGEVVLLPASVAGLADFVEAAVSEVLLEVAAGAAGDDDDVGAVGVGAGAGEGVHSGAPKMSFNSNYSPYQLINSPLGRRW